MMVVNQNQTHPPYKMATLEYFFEQTELTIEDVADRAGLPVERVEAIILGRWTPSPQERSRVAEAFGVDVSEVSWGHSMDPRNVRYRRSGHKS